MIPEPFSRALARSALAAALAGAASTSLRAQQPQRGMPMHMAGALGIPSSRDGSGTAWLPDSTPVRAMYRAAGVWMLMLHGNAFLQYVGTGGSRGRNQLGVTDWVMGVAMRPAAGGLLSLRGMLSSEPLTVGQCGYPDMLASGETCHGLALHDQQHPHDLFMELAAAYERALSRHVAFQLYAAPAGEPALGPVAFPHRPSAMSDPIAPIGHHWLDATHISFGVVTAGLFGHRWKLEGSVFNGREPDEQRYNLDLGPLDSYAARFWLLPSPFWALQVSAGRLNHPERLSPAENLTRTTASVTYHRPLAHGAFWASSLMWGRNSSAGHAGDAVLAESELSLDRSDRVFVRVETVGKTGADLALGVSALDTVLYDVTKVSAGYERRIATAGRFEVGAGVLGDAGVVPAALSGFYGTRTPLGLALYLSIRPSVMSNAMSAMEMRGRPMPMNGSTRP